MRDVAATDLRGALQEMEAVASACPNCQKPFYHASINTRADERLTDEQRMQAIDRLEKELGLTGQPRVVVVHEKKDGPASIATSCGRGSTSTRCGRSATATITASMRLWRASWNGSSGTSGCRARISSATGRPRPAADAEPQGDAAGGAHGHQPEGRRGSIITALWQRDRQRRGVSGEALEESGWILARGDRRDFVAIDPKGGTHSLARRIEGAKAKDVRARLADLDLSSVAERRRGQEFAAGASGGAGASQGPPPRLHAPTRPLRPPRGVPTSGKGCASPRGFWAASARRSTARQPQRKL